MINQAAAHLFLEATKQTGPRAVCVEETWHILLTGGKNYTGLQVAVVFSLFVSTNKVLYIFGCVIYRSHGWSV